ncbi:hypothetical protein NXS97_00405 [Pantoea sp. B623]|uniref:hypothetical protein n=1 Tax=Pantoea sp. B623 TaxID=2974561 RepID=UPI002167314C|nr:hypothetical protein [Pantoea sp. B623]MCS4492675.1 hypothetical protein [Pantoea sp. B623]
MNKIIYPVSLCFLFYLFCPVKRQGGDVISCKASVSYFWNEERLDLLISQDLDGGKGFLSVSGIFYKNDKTKSYLNKTISFSYGQNKEFYHFRSEMIMNSPQMTMSLSEQKMWLPEFFINRDRTMLLKIKPYGKKDWLFYSATSPLFVCESIR